MRAFFAVNLSDNTKDRIAAAIRAIGIDDPPWRWVARDNFHVTLKFLGDVPPEQVTRLAEVASEACRSIAPFSITFGELGGFPNLTRPRVLFYRIVDGARLLARLAERVDESLMAVGVEKERGPFRVHVTVARVKAPLECDLAAALERSPAVSGARETVTSLTLMESHLRRQGVRYQRLKEIALRKPK